MFGGAFDVDDVVRSKWSADPERGEFWTFPLAIKGFFDNGGQRVYVRRVTAKKATAANTTMGKGVVADVVQDALATNDTVKLSSLIGISNGDTVWLVVDAVPMTLKVKSYDTAATTVTFTAAIGKRVKGHRDFLIVKAAAAGSVQLRAKSKGSWGNDLKVRAYPMEAGSFAVMADPTINGNKNDPMTSSVLADVTPAADTFSVQAGDGAKFFKDDHILVDGKPFTVKAMNGDAITINEPAQVWTKDTSVIRVRYATDGTAKTMTVWGASSLYKNALIEFEDPANGTRRSDVIASITNNVVTMTNVIKEKLWEGQKIKLIECHVSVRYSPTDGSPEVLEEHSNLRLKEESDGDEMHISRRLGNTSNLVEAVTPPAIDIGVLDDYPTAVDTSNKATPWQGFGKTGDDDFGKLDQDDFVGEDKGPNKRTGIQALEDIDDISICIVPSIWSSLVQNALILHCETLKYRFAILDPKPIDPNSIDPIGDISAFREGFDTKYAALYFPRIEARDPFTDTTVGLGPSGHMAGIYARVDVERGVHKAPANEVIRGIDTSNGFHGLEDQITKREQDILNPKGINALRFFPDRGTRVWGARTLSSDGSWKYINVRRIFIFVERSIDVGTQWVVFEPNDEKLWARVRQTITNFLTTVWRSGALFGSKADQAFFVRCDRTTMTQDDIDNGRLIVVVGIAPVKPAEFVIFRIQQKLIDQTQP